MGKYIRDAEEIIQLYDWKKVNVYLKNGWHIDGKPRLLWNRDKNKHILVWILFKVRKDNDVAKAFKKGNNGELVF